ncbi:family 4 glycosyltransferase [Melampsora larici-populina 98AG31]|uniref:Family 4 glycosyltransferase n=1 Tax=Melampsora larici-populina (strain 98AG31 / pathotype 3-4-7) TaxID=747676 RepID=F4RE48_MELLP|nr:family 4 glycosyltransferase [Melampsora larici-populina 98AG31]EGG09334.1 family 4 glycosyltransferase [Melampsora larici-populina 98AG31]
MGNQKVFFLLAEVYSVCLKQADYLMVNSTWTKTHVDKLLRPHFPHDSSNPPKLSQIVYPPCDVKTFTSFPLLNQKKIYLCSPNQLLFTHLAIVVFFPKNPLLFTLRFIIMFSFENFSKSKKSPFLIALALEPPLSLR